MNVVRLRRLFSHALRTTVATPLLLAGCQGEPDAPRPQDPNAVDMSQAVEVDCVNGAPTLAGLAIEPAPDLIQLRTINASNPPTNPPLGRTIRTSEGTECATAVDPQTCKEHLEAPTSSGLFPRICHYEVGCAEDYLVMTRGDEVSTYGSAQALTTLLGHVDNAREAAILAYAAGYALCGDAALEPGKVQAQSDGSFGIVSTHKYDCQTNTQPMRYQLRVTPSGEVTVEQRVELPKVTPNCVVVGRRPVGLQDTAVGACEDARGHYFADTARLEAASIHSFLRLREELALHGASPALQDEALLSALDEVRHAEVTTRLALRYGAIPPPPSVEALPLRPLHEVLLDNAVEGCVRETYGALVAHHQALHARDPEIRLAMARIAEDETRHAALSWDIDAWAESRVSSEERRALREARMQAIKVLRTEATAPLDADLMADAGLPSPEVAAALLDTLEQGLWA
jgi:hypothetical protein